MKKFKKNLIGISLIIGLIGISSFATQTEAESSSNLSKNSIKTSDFQELSKTTAQPLGGKNISFLGKGIVSRFITIIKTEVPLRVALVTVMKNADDLISFVENNSQDFEIILKINEKSSKDSFFNQESDSSTESCQTEELDARMADLIEEYKARIENFSQNLIVLFNALMKIYNSKSAFEKKAIGAGLGFVIERCLKGHGIEAYNNEPYYKAISMLNGKKNEIEDFLKKLSSTEPKEGSLLGNVAGHIAILRDSKFFCIDIAKTPQVSELMDKTIPLEGRGELEAYLESAM